MSLSKVVAGGPYLPPVSGKKLARSRRGVLASSICPRSNPSLAPRLQSGAGGGDIGKKINHGGGDGGDDDGNDDDYFDDFDDGDEGDEGGLFRRRKFLEELFDRKFVDGVLNEWQKTMMDLPAGFRQAYEMGLVSSAQMVKFLAINARPTTTRFIS
nr:hypothetical protein CFP56_45805 [Quercus suber]